jgi:polar amino acid transport system permease protein
MTSTDRRSALEPDWRLSRDPGAHPKPSRRDAKAIHGGLRLRWLDVLVFGIAIALVAFVFYRVNSVLQYKWDWSRIWPFLFRWDDEHHTWVANLLIQGFATTIRLAVWGIVLSAIIGFGLGLCRTTERLLPRLVSRAYVELIRNLPPLIFMFIFYYFISSPLTSFLHAEDAMRDASPAMLATMSILAGPPKLFANFLAGLLCVAMFEGAYITEIVRAGIQSVNKGQREAGQSIGLSKYDIARFIIMPQALRRVLPPLAGQFISLIKTSAIVSLISIQELTFLAGEIANSTGRLFEVWILVAGMYFALCFVCSVLFQRLETRWGVNRDFTPSAI